MEVSASSNYKGLNTDKDKRFLQEGEYSYALNALYTNKPFLVNDFANELCIDLEANVIGSVYIDNYIHVVFLDNNSIWKLDLKDCTKTLIYANDCLQLNTCNWIKARHTKLNDCGKSVIYFTDGINSTKYINIDDPNISSIDCTDLLLNPCNISPVFKEITVQDYGGNLDSGVYIFAISFVGENGLSTNWTLCSEPVYVYEDKFNGNLYENISGNATVLGINKSIRIDLENLETTYNEIKIAVIYTNDRNTNVKLIYQGTYTTNFTYNFTGITLEDITLSLAEIVTNNTSFFTANDLEFKDNRLLLAGIKGIKNINYQKYANNIKVNYFTRKVRLDSYPMINKNPNLLSEYRTWLRDEIYSLGIVWKFCDGTHSVAFPLIGRTMDCFTDYNGSTADIEGLAYCDDILVDNDANTIDCDLVKWKNRNTAVRTTLYDCEPFTVFQPIVERVTCTYLSTTNIDCDCMEICDNFNPTISNLENECTNIGTDDNGYSIYECYHYITKIILPTTHTISDVLINPNIPVNPTICNTWTEREISEEYIEYTICGNKLANLDVCELSYVVECDYSKGELAYYESCEKYPDIKDCDGNLMFPHTLTDNGYIMDNIRLFKMPDNIIEPCFDCYNDNYVERQNRSIGSADTGRPYDDCYIYPIGLEFNNIELPDDIDKNMIKGYEIVYIKRNSTNKSILGKGILHGCYRNSNGDNDKLYAVPKHGVNSKIYFNADLNGYETHLGKNEQHIAAYTLMSPNLLFDKPSLFGDYIHIEGEYYGKGEVYGERENINNGDCDNIGRRQNININSHRISRKWTILGNGELQINRKLKGLVYAPANSVISATNNITFPLWNIWRESSTYIELDTNNNDYLQLASDTSAWDNVLNYCMDNEDTDTFYSTTQNIHDCDDSLQDTPYFPSNNYHPIPKAGAWYISIKRNVCNLYGDITNQSYTTTGLNSIINNANNITTPLSVKGFYGDSYINYWAYRRTSNLMVKSDGTPSSSDIGSSGYCDPFSGVIVKTLVHSIVESDYNVELRHGTDVINEVFYPDLNNHQLYLDSGIPDYAASSNSYLNSFYYLDTTGDCEEQAGLTDFSDNFYAINPDYAIDLNVNSFVSIGNKYKTCDCNVDLPNRILYSEVSNLKNYNFNVFRSENYIDIPYQHGIITNILVLNNKLYAHTTDTLWQIFTNEKQLELDDTTIYLGTGDLFGQIPYPIYANSVGYGGNKYQHGILQTELGYFWIDDYAGKVHMFNDNIDVLSDYGMQYWFKNNSKYCYSNTCDSPIIFAYDHYNNRLLLTKKDADKSYTISYSFNNKAWISFHSFIPDYYLWDRNNYYTVKDKLIYRHNVQCKYNNYYGKIEPYVIELVVGTKPSNYSTMFESIQFNCETYKCVEDNCSIVYIDEETFNKLLVYNSNQTTGIMDIQINKGQYLRNQLEYPNILVDKSRRHFSLNKLRDYSSEFAYNNLSMFTSNGVCNCDIDKQFNTAYIDSNKYYMQLQKLKDKYLVVRLILDNKDNIQLLMDSLITVNNVITR